ncbi:Glutaredoxin domain-containing protein, partial [Meloidogyne graminicola]
NNNPFPSSSFITTTTITTSIEQQQQPIQRSVTSIQSITQQILRLPAVLYSNSKSSSSRKLETLLREIYGLPLVTFYVDRIGNEKPKLVEYNLEQLTAHKGLPYLFICGTFIGSKEHILNYHKQKQIPQLVEYVCNKENKKETINLKNILL